MMTDKDLHLKYRMENGFYPPQQVVGHWNSQRTWINGDDTNALIKYIRWLEGKILGPLPTQMPGGSSTCTHCLDNDTCEFAFDKYNTDGDCLAIK